MRASHVAWIPEACSASWRSRLWIFHALEDRSPWYILAFAGACGLGSIYGFMQGAWPFGLIEAIGPGSLAGGGFGGHMSHDKRSCGILSRH